jgi:predicted ABC-type ATPase
MPHRRMLVVAGPPGSGKTTYFPVTEFGVDSFNIDDRCAQIQGSYRAISRDVRRSVAKECERFVRKHIEQGTSFAVETTLRTTAAIEQAATARARGFATQMRFVATSSIAENVARIVQRAQGGGHAASERDIRAIHEASVQNLGKALPVFDVVRIYDSTAPWTAPRLVATARSAQVVRHGESPAWLDRALSALTGK